MTDDSEREPLERRARLRGLIAGARRQAAGSDSSGQAALVASGNKSGLLSGTFAGYDILGELHRGGQGVVYRAIQKSTNRSVAIKVLKEGPFAGSAERTRFEREVQILGALRHPNIVTIHDSGSVAGQHYFAMDFIPGQPLDTYFAGGRPSIRGILALFLKMCDAVNAAHLLGIVHRDLKPSNIRIDEAGAPHVLDFGLARSADAADESPSEMTMTGQFVGSVPWASPEQARGERGMIDARSDVYSIGVMLYQALVGRFPYAVTGNMADVLSNIQRTEPLRPRALRREIDDEVETIVLRCLDKDPQRRYQSAGELSGDIGRYLADEPIKAKRDSRGYVLRKYLSRHRIAAGAAAGFVVLISIGFAVSFTFWRQSEAERHIAELEKTIAADARTLAETQRDRARDAEQTADRRRAEAEAITALLQEMLGSADTRASSTPDYTVRQMLDSFSTTLGDRLKDQPLVEAAIRATVGSAYSALAQFDKARPHLIATLEIRRRLLGDVHSDVGEAFYNLGVLEQDAGNNVVAETYLREALRIARISRGENNSWVITVLNKLAAVLEARGDVEGSDALLMEAIDIRGQIDPDADPDATVSLKNTLALRMMGKGDYAGAERAFRETLQWYRGKFGEQHPYVATALNNLADVRRLRGDYVQAEQFHRHALAIRRHVLTESHPDLAASLNNLALVLHDLKRFDEAEPLFCESLEILRSVYGEKHPNIAVCMANLALTLHGQKNYIAAETIFREALEVQCELSGRKSAVAARTMCNLANTLIAQGQYPEAETFLREGLAIRERRLEPGHWLQFTTMCWLGQALIPQGAFEEAETLLLTAYSGLESNPQSPPERLIDAMTQLGELYYAWGKPQQAAEWSVRKAEAANSLRPDADR